MPVLAAGVVCMSLMVHAWHAVGTAAYVDFVTGVWLALADDLAHGVFYRDLVGPDGYGGTRYFPLFFTAIGLLMRLGLSPLAAGFLVSAIAAGLLVAAIQRLLSRFGLPPALAVAVAVFALAPRFVQQGLLAIRSDMLSAALVLWGLEFTLSASDAERPRLRAPVAAAGCFTLAVATKVTSLYAPVGVVLALVWAAKPRVAFRLGWMTAAGVAAMIGITAAASRGRAVESWLACGLAGAGITEWLARVPSVFVLQVVGPSRVFTVVLAIAVAAWVAAMRTGGPKLLTVFFPVTIGAAAVVLASPGTSYTNQLVDALAISLLIIGWVLARFPRVRPAGVLVLTLLSLAAARQSLVPVFDGSFRQHASQRSAERQVLIAELAAGGTPVLSESPDLLVLGGGRPYLLDPFTLRVVSIRRPDLLGELRQDLDARRFSRVVLLYDPEDPPGRGWYANVNFGSPIMARILANYEFDEEQAGVRVYRPRVGPFASAP